jgi:hypothetical protein
MYRGLSHIVGDLDGPFAEVLRSHPRLRARLGRGEAITLPEHSRRLDKDETRWKYSHREQHDTQFAGSIQDVGTPTSVATTSIAGDYAARP